MGFKSYLLSPKEISAKVSQAEDMASYKGREAASRGGLVGALEEYARTGVPVGEKYKSDHIGKAEQIFNILKNEEKKIKNSTLSQTDKETLLLRINNLRNSIMPAYQKAKQRKSQLGVNSNGIL